MSTKEKLSERQFIIECIELYETLPALWNTKCKDYSNRDKKNQQYELLLSKYKERFINADKADLVKKFNSLRTNFRKELKKISDSQKSGAGTDDMCEPSLWYFDNMKFLTDTAEPCSSQTSMLNEEDSNNNKDNIEEFQSKGKPLKRKQKDDSELLISLACKRLSQPKNEFDSIAKTWANDLQKMDHMQQLYAKKAISEILFEGQLGNLNRNSFKINRTCDNLNNSETSNPDIVYCESPEVEYIW